MSLSNASELYRLNYNPETLKLIEQFSNARLKHDFFKYTLLYLYGGIAVDFANYWLPSLTINPNVSEWSQYPFKQNKVVLVQNNNSEAFSEHLVISTYPRHPLIAEILNCLLDPNCGNGNGNQAEAARDYFV